MKSKINIYNLETEENIPYHSLFFSAGEPHVDLGRCGLSNFFGKDILVDARIADCDGFMMLAALADAIYRLQPNKIYLAIPYLPASRQDRTQPGFAFTSRIYNKIINSMEFDGVYTVDPHSNNSIETLRCCRIIENYKIFSGFYDYEANGIIAPDKGAEYRAKRLAEHLRLPFFQCEKTRDSTTGKLSGFVAPENMSNGHYLIADDLVDGGQTFIGLADKIREQNPNITLDLYVSHGIFSKGVEELATKFNRIITTDSWPDQPDHTSITRINLLPILFREVRISRKVF